jgi:hypothetical protein
MPALSIKISQNLLTVGGFLGRGSSIRVPLTGRNQLVDPLELNMPVRVDEFLEAHVATTNAHNKLVVHNLGVDLPRTKHVEALLALELANRHIDRHLVDVFGEQVVDRVVALRCIATALLRHLRLRPREALLWRELRGLLAKRLLQTFNNDLLVAEDVLERLKLLLLLLEDQLQLLALVLDFTDLTLQLAVGLLAEQQLVLELADDD